MSQRDFLRRFDRMLVDHFQRAGLAFNGGYRAPGAAFTSPAQPVGGFLDRGVEFFGELSQVVGQRDEMTLLLQDVTPIKGGYVDADGERFLLVEKLQQDEGNVRFAVREVAIVSGPGP